MKIYYVPQFHPEQAREVADIDETKFQSPTKWLDSMDDAEYEAFVDANGDEGRYYGEVRVFYGLYKELLKGCMTKSDSYDPDTKTIVVYVRNWGEDLDAKRQLYDILHKKQG